MPRAVEAALDKVRWAHSHLVMTAASRAEWQGIEAAARAEYAALESLEALNIELRNNLRDATASQREVVARFGRMETALKLADGMQAETCEACGAVYPVCQEHITCRTTFAYRAARAKVQP